MEDGRKDLLVLGTITEIGKRRGEFPLWKEVSCEAAAFTGIGIPSHGPLELVVRNDDLGSSW
jgi:hypothetical protein